MKKRILSWLLAITIAFSFTANGFAMSVVPAETETVLVQTFESETAGSAPADWSVTHSGDSGAAASTFDVYSDANGKYMRMLNPAAARTDTAIRTLSDAYTGHITLSFKFHNKANMSYNGVYILDESDNVVAQFSANKDSKISYSTYYSASFTYNTWHDIVFDVDTNAKTYDFYYDGTKLNSEAVPFVSDAAANVKKIKITLSQANTLMFDDFVVRKDRSNAVDEVTLISDDFESETNGTQITASNSVGAWSRVSGPDYVEGTADGGQVTISGIDNQYLSFHNTTSGNSSKPYIVKRIISNYDNGIETSLGGILEVSMNINAIDREGRFYIHLKDSSGKIITTLSYVKDSSGQIKITDGNSSIQSSFGTNITGDKAHKLIIDTNTKKILWSIDEVQQAIVDYRDSAADALSYVECEIQPTSSNTYYLLDNFTVKSINVDPLESITYDAIINGNANKNNIKTDLLLPASYEYLGHSYNLVWSSDNTDVISNSGIVTKPKTDEIVNMTVTTGKNSKKFKFLVPSEGTVLLFDDLEDNTEGTNIATSGWNESDNAKEIVTFTAYDENGNNVCEVQRNGDKSYPFINKTISPSVQSGIFVMSARLKFTSQTDAAALRFYRINSNGDPINNSFIVQPYNGKIRVYNALGISENDKYQLFKVDDDMDWFNIEFRLNLDERNLEMKVCQNSTKETIISELSSALDNNGESWFNRKNITQVGFSSDYRYDGVNNTNKSKWYFDDLIVKNVDAESYNDGNPEDISSLKLNQRKEYAIFEKSENMVFDLMWENVSSDIEKTVNIKIKDYYGKTVNNTRRRVDKTKTSYAIQIGDLPFGHYKIEATICQKTVTGNFSVVPNLNERRPSDKNIAAFATMQAVVNNEYNTSSEATVENYVKTIRLAGVHNVRDAIRMNTVSMENGSYEYPKKLTWLINKYNDCGIKTLLMLEDAPEYMRSKGKGTMPDNLLALYNFTKNLSETYGNKIDGIEFLNEIESPHCVDSTDTQGATLYASSAKAAALGIYDAKKGIKATNAGSCLVSAYRKMLLQNEVADYINYYTDHDYMDYDSNSYEPNYRKDSFSYAQDLDSFLCTNKEIHISETGVGVPYNNDYTELTDEQQKYVARIIPKAFVDAASNGVTKYYWFLHGYYSIGGNSFSTLSKTKQPYSCYSAVSAFTNSLGNAKYYGKITGIDSNVTGHAFYDNGEYIGCFWSNGKKSISIPTAESKAILTDIMGNETTITSENGYFNIDVSEDIVYLRMSDPFNVENVANFDEKNTDIIIDDAHHIVMQQIFDASSSPNTRITQIYELNPLNDTMTLRVYNFNKGPSTVTVKPSTFGGWETDKDKTTITIPSMGYIDIDYSLNLSENRIADVFVSPLVFECEVDGKASSSSVSYIKSVPCADFANIIGSSTDISNWRATGENCTVIKKTSETPCTFSLKYDEYTTTNARNRYINATLSGVLANELSGSKGILFNVKSSKYVDNVVFRVWMNMDGKKYRIDMPPMAIDGTEQTVSFDWSKMFYNNVYDFDISNADPSTFSITVHNQSKTVTDFDLSITNVGVYTSGSLTHPTAQNVAYDNGKIVSEIQNNDIEAKSVYYRLDDTLKKGTILDSQGVCEMNSPNGTVPVTVYVKDLSNYPTVIKTNINVLNGGFIINNKKLIQKDNIKVSFDVYNQTGKGYVAENELSVFGTFYNSKGKVLNIVPATIELVPNEKKSVSLDFDICDENYDVFKAFIWSKSMIPMSIPISSENLNK